MKNVILILGMHRSGTSALTRVVSLLGAALPKSLLGKNDSNLRGHWESEKLIAAHDAFLAQCGSNWKDWRRLALGRKHSMKSRRAMESFQTLLDLEFSQTEPVWLVKEPRICRFSQLYLEALKEGGAEVHSVIMVRSPLEIAASLQARDTINKLDALYLWLTHMLEAEFATRNSARSFVSYDTLIKSPLRTAKKLQAEMPFTLPYKADDVKEQIEDYINPGLKRHAIKAEDIVLDPVARGWVSEAYNAFVVLCTNPNSQDALGKLDRVRDAYFSVLEPLHEILSYERGVFQQSLKKQTSDLTALHLSATADLEAQQKAMWSQRDAEFRDKWEARDKENSIAWRERDDAHSAAVEQLTQEHEVELTALRQRYDTGLDDARVQHKNELAEQQSHFKTELAELRSGYDSQLAEQRSRYETELAELRSGYDSQLADQQSRYEAELGKQRAHHEALVADLQASHKQTLDHLQNETNFMRDEFGEILRTSDARADYHAVEAESLKREISAVLNSRSWRMTGGLRRIINRLKGVKTQAPSRHIEATAAPPRLEFRPED